MFFGSLILSVFLNAGRHLRKEEIDTFVLNKCSHLPQIVQI